MAEVVWTEPALQQLDAIAKYIALDHPLVRKISLKQCLTKQSA